MVNPHKFRTIQDMEQYYYGTASYLLKADAPITSTTTGHANAVAGAFAWTQFNREASLFGALPKYPHTHTDIRFTTVRAATSGGGVTETAALPDSIKPTRATAAPTIKTMAHMFEVTEIQEFLVTETRDDNFGSIDQSRADTAEHHKEMINVAMTTDFDTLASNNFESIDRITASTSETTGVGATADDENIYGIDRSANSWADATSLHASNVDRPITFTLLNNLFFNVRQAGGNPTFLVTGHDTYAKIQGLFLSLNRYTPLGEAKATFDVNGVSTATGLEYGENVATVNGKPLILSKDVIKDGISRIYSLDTSDPGSSGEPRLGFRVALPTQYFEAGTNTGNPFAIDKLATQGLFRTTGELICQFFAAQGKLRDLQ